MNQLKVANLPNEILTAKLLKPPVRQVNVERPHLIEILNSAQNKKLSIISAPAGFGKSTLVSQWASNSSKPVVWLSLDEEDNDVVRFLIYFIEAIRIVYPNVGRDILIALRLQQMPNIKSILSQLINEIEAIQCSFSIIIDDYHLIKNNTIDQGICFLVEHMPLFIHLIVVSRDIPKLRLSKLRAKNQLNELNIQDLRFSDMESEYFLKHVMGLNVSKNELVTLEKKIEGWVVGLQLAALSIQGHKESIHLVESFSGEHNFVMDYLFDEVLIQLPENIQKFLMITSFLDRFCGSLCDVVLSDDLDQSNWSSEKTIEYLERNNLFIIQLDNDRRWYRYHHLFSDSLKARLEKQLELFSEDDTIVKIHKRASYWYEKNGYIVEAFKHSVKANDFTSAIRLVEGDGVPLLYRGAATPVMKWLEALPDSTLSSNPSLRVLYASGLLFVGRVGEVENNLVLAERSLVAFPWNEKKRDLIGHISVIKATLAISQNNLSKIIKYSQRAIKSLSPSNLTALSATKWALGYAYQMQLNNRLARQFYEESLMSSQAISHFIVIVLSLIGLGNVYESEDRLKLAESTYKRVLELPGHSSFPASSVAYLGLSRIAYQKNCIPEALEYIQTALELSQYLKDMETYATCEIFHAKLKLAQGQISETTRLLKKANQWLYENNCEKSIYKVAQVEVRMQLYLKDIRSAEYIANTYNLKIEQIRVQLEIGNPLQAIAILESFSKESSIEILILRARSYYQAGDMEKALIPFFRALEISKEEGHIRIFLDEGDVLKALLKKALQLKVMADQISIILEKYSMKDTLTDTLTQRELEVLKLIAQGLTNEEISKALFVSLNTVKGHNQRIFSKLQVKNRTEAILKSQVLNLIKK